MEPPMKFLVVQQKMIGDVLASTVICESLKHHFPTATVHIVANENTLPVLYNNPFIDDVVVFKNEYRERKLAFYNFLTSLKKTKYTAVIDAYGKLESNLITLFANSEQKISNRKWYTSWIYSHTIRQLRFSGGKVPLSISNRLLLLHPILSGASSFITRPKLFLSKKELDMGTETIDGFREGAKKIIMVPILGSAANKTYPAVYMAEILEMICNRYDVKLLFNYLPSQKENALEIYHHCSQATQQKIEIDFYANSLRDFIAVVSQCDMIMGNEGGAINMAKAVDIPSFSIFSPYIPKANWLGEEVHSHEGVHLNDFRPELFEGMDKRKLKKNSQELYQHFEPELFKKKLVQFLKYHFDSATAAKPLI